MNSQRLASEAEEQEIEALFQKNKRVWRTGDTIRLQMAKSFPVQEYSESEAERTERLGHEWRFYPVQACTPQQEDRVSHDHKFERQLWVVSLANSSIFFAAWAVFLFLIAKGR